VDPARETAPLVTQAQVAVDVAWRTPQFWLLWVVLCMNVTAGIAVLSQASPMIQEIFSGRVSAEIAASFVGLLSLFNMVGRFFWASTSDYIGRRNTYFVFFALGILLYSTVPSIGYAGSIPLFVAAFVIILSMYGGGFATIPAYLRDVFGTMHVGAIHGRLLTAWSAAGVLGRCSSTTSANTRSSAVYPRLRPIRSPCTSCAACSLSGSFVIFACVP